MLVRRLHVCALLMGLCTALGCNDDADETASDGGPDSAVPADGCASPASPAEAGEYTLTVASGGEDRTALMYVPEATEPQSPAMLVLAFHGFGSSGARTAVLTGLSSLADERDFLVVYPNGLSSAWSAGTCCPGAAMDDVQFVRDLVAKIRQSHCIDPGRIFATGISNGGLFTNRLACEAADLVAAVAPVSAGIGVTCEPSRPVAHLAFAGNADDLVPLSVTEMEVEDWRGINGCTGESTVVFAEGDATCERWSSCDEDQDVELCLIDGGGHTWPGGMANAALGKTSTDLDASSRMIDFFEDHPRL